MTITYYKIPYNAEIPFNAKMTITYYKIPYNAKIPFNAKIPLNAIIPL
jgi:hypothetical protein